MNIKDIAEAIIAIDQGLSCKVSNKHQQIKLFSESQPGEVKILLSPYYQKRLKENVFNNDDLEGVLEEVKTFMEQGV